MPDIISGHSQIVQNGDGCQCIADVITPINVQLYVLKNLPAIYNVELQSASVHLNSARAPIALRICAKGFLTAQTVSADLQRRRTVPTNGQKAVLRHKIDETAELKLYGIQVCIDIGVIELYVSDNSQIREVVEKFWAFVKKSRIVFISFDHEME